MSSANCDCCGKPTTAPESVAVIDYDCHCGCGDCDTCEECFHECECGDCEECGYADEAPVVLCDECQEDGDCQPGAWHCTCGRACDGSACPGEAALT